MSTKQILQIVGVIELITVVLMLANLGTYRRSCVFSARYMGWPTPAVSSWRSSFEVEA